MKKSAAFNKISNTDIIDKHTDSVQIYWPLQCHYTHMTLHHSILLTDWWINQLKGL
jgi:hypothetical protein